jgi:adenine-specific DNA-methyltransferase
MQRPVHQALSKVEVGPSSTPATRRKEVEDLHRRCGIYTKAEVVLQILDAIGWTACNDLSKSRLLEPAAGDGAFVAEAALRLINSFRRCRVDINVRFLRNSIRAFEIHPAEARKARLKVAATLRELGLHHATSIALATAWIRNEDFLLSPPPMQTFTHVAGNPPYVRWPQIPNMLRIAYAKALPREIIGGDLFLPFLDRSLEQLQPLGRCGFLCTDRWRFMAFAEHFRAKWLPYLEIQSERSVIASNVYTSGRRYVPIHLNRTANSKK